MPDGGDETTTKRACAIMGSTTGIRVTTDYVGRKHFPYYLRQAN